MAKSLYEVKQANKALQWTVKCEYVFRTLKVALRSVPSFYHTFLVEGKYVMDTDTRNTGLGAMVFQGHCSGESLIAHC